MLPRLQRARLLCFVAAWLVGGTAVVLAQAPGGAIRAEPNPCTVSAGATHCASVITWETQGVTVAEVTVVDPFAGPEKLFARATSGRAEAPWIPLPPDSAVFTLYDASSGTRVRLASVTVTGVASQPFGTIRAEPNPCTIPQGTSLCTSTIIWETQNVASADVTVQDPLAGIEYLFARALSGRVEAPWIPAPLHSALFTLYDSSSGSRARLASVNVTATTGILVSVLPLSVSLRTGQSQAFTALVSGTTDTRVTWSVNDQPGGSPTLGTITPQGFYTAPASAPNPATVTVKATSVADSSKFATATVTIVGVATISSVRPASFALGATGPITVTVDGANFSTASAVRVDFGSGPEARGTEFVSGARLRAILTGSDFAQERSGFLDVFQTPAGPTSNRVPIVVSAAPVAPQTVFVIAGQTTAGNDIRVTDASASPGLNISFVGIGTARSYSTQVNRGTQATILIFGTGLSERDTQNPDTILARASVRLSGPADITIGNVEGIFSSAGRPGLRFTVTVSPTAQTGPRNILAENANHDLAIAFGALVIR